MHTSFSVTSWSAENASIFPLTPFLHPGSSQGRYLTSGFSSTMPLPFLQCSTCVTFPLACSIPFNALRRASFVALQGVSSSSCLFYEHSVASSLFLSWQRPWRSPIRELQPQKQQEAKLPHQAWLLNHLPLLFSAVCNTQRVSGCIYEINTPQNATWTDFAKACIGLLNGPHRSRPESVCALKKGNQKYRKAPQGC